jgi:hypothetical protein
MVERGDLDDVDAYLDGVLAHLLLDLHGAQLVDAWTVDGEVPGQRFVLHHRVEGAPVATVQQHSWIDDTIVVVTATTAIDAPDELVSTLCGCLDSVVAA